MQRYVYGTVAVMLALAWFAGALAAGPPVPLAGFSDTQVVPVASPTALAFTPDGRMLVTSQSGQLRVYQNGTPTLALDLTIGNRICNNHERGLLGVAIDPAFALNQFIYLYYTFNKYPSSDPALNCPDVQPTNPNNPVNRVSRFVLPASNITDPNTETILIDNIPSTNGNHNAGDLQFGKDGYLYISIGDGGADYTRNYAQASGNYAARDTFILLGKILRIKPDGSLPADNPWMGADSARCYDPTPGGNKTARNADGKKCRETFAWGLRNPFRIAFDSNAAGTHLFINDVGQGTWEEIDEGQPGADYGWNLREGHCASGSGATTDCGPPPTGMTNPIFDYQHGSAPNNCNAISGGAFVPNGLWPAEYEGTYLFGDYVCGRIFKLAADGAGGYTRTDFITNVGAVIALRFGPYAGGQALYYTTFGGGGQVRRVTYSGSGNRSPNASVSANPTAGAAPLAVSFNGSASSDPDGDVLTYDWDFGDGTPHVAAPAPTHIYAAGTYTATLRVSDGKGGSDTATVRIDSGNTPPQPIISAPDPSLRFHVGQSITLQGSAADAQDGALPPERLTWRAVLHHNDHTHPFLPPTAGSSVTIVAPPPEDLSATHTSYLEVELTATDSHGLTGVITRELRPNLVDLSFATDPAGLNVMANELALNGPQSLTSWEGFAIAIGAASQSDDQSIQWLFDRWSDGGAATHTIITPPAPAVYTATFHRVAPGELGMRIYLPMMLR
jgi:glucose/arabinose dehydrogenase